MNKAQKLTYGLMTSGAAIGFIAAFLQTLEKFQILKNKDSVLACNFNAVFNCSTVLDAPQSALFGFPNSLMCMFLFTMFFATGLAGLTGSVLSRGIRLGIQALALFTLLFALWFMWQTIYVISALCIFCIFCFAGLLVVNGAWLRVNAGDLPLGPIWQARLQRAIKGNWDIFIWLALAAVVGLAMLIRFI